MICYTTRVWPLSVNLIRVDYKAPLRFDVVLSGRRELETGVWPDGRWPLQGKLAAAWPPNHTFGTSHHAAWPLMIACMTCC